MTQSSIKEKLDLKRHQVVENHKQNNEFYISPNLSVDKINSIENKIIQKVELNFDDLSTCSLFLNFINEKSVISNPAIALITGLPGMGKSQMLIELENLFWKQFNINSDYQIVPIKIILNKCDDNSIQTRVEQKILEYFDFDQSELQQLRQKNNNKEIKLIFLIDLPDDIQIDQFTIIFEIIKQLNQQWHECKVFLSIHQNMNNQLKHQCKNNKQSFTNFHINFLSQNQVNNYFKMNLENQVRIKVRIILENFLSIFENPNIINNITNVLLQEVNQKQISLKQSQKFFKQLKQLTQQSNVKFNLNEIIEKFELELKNIWSVQKYKSFFRKYQFNLILDFPLILKLFVEALPEIDQIHSVTKQFDVFETLFLNILQVENIQQVNLKQIYLFAIQIIETEVFQQDETVESIFEIITSLSNNPFISTKYLNHLWLSKAFVDFFIAYYIHEEVIAKKNEAMELEIAHQQNLVMYENDQFFFNKFDSQNLDIYQKIKFNCDFDKVIMNSENYSGVLNFLKEKCWLNTLKVDKLLNIIKASSVIENFEQEAGNAFTILKELKGFYKREDFSKIKLKNCSLDGCQFYQCNFSYSKMENFSIYDCYFNGCSLDFTVWQQMKSYLICTLDSNYITFSANNKYIATNFTLDNYGHPKFHIKKKVENSEVVVSFSYDSRHFISKRNDNNDSHTISCIFIQGKRQFNRKICQSFANAEYFTNDHIIVATDDYFRYYNIKTLKLLRKLKKLDESTINLSYDYSIQAINEYCLIEFYNTKTFKNFFSLEGFSPCKFVPNNSFVFLYYRDGKIYAKDIQKQQKEQILWNSNNKFEEQDLAISDNLILISRSKDRNQQLYFWDLKKCGKLLTILNLSQIIDYVQFLKNTNLLKITIFPDSVLLDINAIEKKSNSVPLQCDFQKIALSDKILVAYSFQKEIFFWDIQFGIMLGKINYKFTIVCLQISYNNSILAIGRQDRAVELWDVQTIKKIQYYGNLKNELTQLIFSYDDQLLAVACCDKKVYFYNVETGKQQLILKFQTELNSIAFSPDCQRFLVGGSNGQVIQTNLKSLECKVIYDSKKLIQLVLYRPNGIQMVFSTKEEIILWDSEKNIELDKQEADELKIYTFNQNFIIISDVIYRCILQFNQEKIEDIFDNSDYIDSQFERVIQDKNFQNKIIAISPNTNILVIVGNDQIMKILNLNHFITQQKKQEIMKPINHTDFSYSQKIPIAICENSNIIASGTENGYINIWSTQNGQLLLRLNQFTSSIECLDFSPTQPILAFGSMDKTIMLWNIENGELIRKLEGHKKGVLSIAFSEDGKFFASGGLDFKVIIWNSDKYQIYKEFKGYSSEIVSVSFSPNGKIFGFAELNGLVHIWDIQILQFIQIEQFEKKLLWIKFKTNNELLILTKEEIIQWQMNSQEKNIIKLENLIVTAAFYNKKSEQLLVYGQKRVRIYDFNEQKFVNWNDRIRSTIITFSSQPSNKNSNYQVEYDHTYQQMYALKDKNNTVTISDNQLEDSNLQIQNYKGFPIASCLSNDQKILALSNWDKYLKIWDLQKNCEMCSTNKLDIQINHMKFSQKGDLLACRTFEKIIILFNQNLQEVNRLELPDICYSDIFISPDSQLIACEIGKDLFIWKVDQSNFIQKVQTFNFYDKLAYLDFSKDKQYLEYGFKDNFDAVIWDIKAQNCCCQVPKSVSEYQFFLQVACFSLPLQKNLWQFESISNWNNKVYYKLGDFVLDQDFTNNGLPDFEEF